jgi:hypothetical protein
MTRSTDQSNVAELSNDPILLEVRHQFCFRQFSAFSDLIMSFVLLQGLHAKTERYADHAVRNKFF